MNRSLEYIIKAGYRLAIPMGALIITFTNLNWGWSQAIRINVGLLCVYNIAV